MAYTPFSEHGTKGLGPDRCSIWLACLLVLSGLPARREVSLPRYLKVEVEWQVIASDG